MDNLIDWEVYFFGSYEHVDVELMRRFASAVPRAVFLDIGANIGHHTLALAPVCAHVHAFEPFPPAVAEFLRKLSVAGLRNITLHEVGLSDADAELPYSILCRHNTANGSFARSGGEICLPVRAGDHYFTNAGIDRVDLIKLDVEGYELTVLSGVAATLVRERPVVVIELNHPIAAIAVYLPHDYAILGLCSPHHSPADVALVQFDVRTATEPNPLRRNVFCVPKEKMMTLFSL